MNSNHRQTHRAREKDPRRREADPRSRRPQPPQASLPNAPLFSTGEPPPGTGKRTSALRARPSLRLVFPGLRRETNDTSVHPYILAPPPPSGPHLFARNRRRVGPRAENIFSRTIFFLMHGYKLLFKLL